MLSRLKFVAYRYSLSLGTVQRETYFHLVLTDYSLRYIGSCPVAEFLDELEPKMWAKITRNIDVQIFSVDLWRRNAGFYHLSEG